LERAKVREWAGDFLKVSGVEELIPRREEAVMELRRYSLALPRAMLESIFPTGL
jgi:hypothetical protein